MANMNFNHLRYFWEVARDGNLTRTAARLNLSQSAVSVQIRKLEDRLGHPLFDRRGRQLHLTEVGRIVLDHAETIFGTGRDLMAVLARTGSPRQVLRVGALATLSRNFQVEFLRPLLAEPDVELVLRSGTSVELMQGLETLGLDVVLTNRVPAPDAMLPLVTHTLSQQPVTLVGTPRRIGQGETLVELLTSNAVIVPTVDNPVRAGFDMLCSRLDVTPVLAAEVDDMAMMRLLAREDVGLAVLPRIVVRDELISGQLTEADHAIDLVVTFHAVTVRRQFPNPLLDRLLGPGTGRDSTKG